MKVGTKSLIFVMLCSLLSACSNMSTRSGAGSMAAAGGSEISGGAVSGMDSIDRNKMYHALDSSPGKSTQWQNASTGATYTVTPIRKTTVGDNKFCREYQITKTVGSNVQNSTGTACVGTDGSWKSV